MAGGYRQSLELNGWRIKHAGTVDRRAGLDSPDRNRRDYGPDYRGRGDCRSQRDEGYSGDSGYRRAYPDLSSDFNIVLTRKDGRRESPVEEEWRHTGPEREGSCSGARRTATE
jgi:hypothetical protein